MNMLKHKMYIISMAAICLLIGCGNSNIEQNDGGIQDGINFSEYSGYWSYEGKTHEQILAEGGIGLSCTITGNNQFSGLLFSQQEITGRLASIGDISGKIEQAELYFDYTDDEWGNSGTLHIQFLGDSIHVEVLNDKNADNDSDYGIGGSFELIRENEDIAGNEVLGNNVAKNEVAEDDAVGNEVAGNEIAEDEAVGNGVAGNRAAGNEIVGNEIAEDEVAGKETAWNNSVENEVAENNTVENNIIENNTVAASSYNSSWTEEEMISAINERSQYYKASAYYFEIIDYWENVREVRDISNVVEPLFETDRKYYTKEEFESEPMLVIHLAKNEIYARHGYIFANKDLYNYFMGCIWYSPTCDSANFDDSIFNKYEKANLEILKSLDTY